MEKIIVQNRGSPGLLAGIFGCVLGILGIFSWGLIFVPLALLCSIVGFIRGVSGPSASGIGTSALAAALSGIGFMVSPSLWALLGIGSLIHSADTSHLSRASAPADTSQHADASRISKIPPATSRQARPAEIPYVNPLWDTALVDLFGRDANAVYDKTGQKRHAVWFAYPYQDSNTTLYAVFTKTLVENADGSPSECHACGMLISVATYQQQGKQWSLQAVQSNVGTFGEWGKVPDVNSPEKLQLSASDFVLLIDFDEYHTGETTRGKRLLNRTANGWRFIGDIVTHDDYAGSVQLRYAYDSTLSLVSQPNDLYPSIRVARVGTEYDAALRQVVPASTVFYEFESGKYIEQRRQP